MATSTTDATATTSPTTPSPTPTPKPTSPEQVITQARSAAEDLVNFYKGFAGQSGFNPFRYLSDVVWPLQNIVIEGDVNDKRTLEAANKLLALTKDETLIKVKVTATPVPTKGARRPVTEVTQQIVK